jgi:GTP-binding protein
MDEAGGLAERVRFVNGGRMTNERNDALPFAAPRRLAVIAIVGRPNVGKSTFFNRLVRAQRAIVDSRPGVTRDRNIAIGRWREREFLLVDTGGYEDAEGSSIAAAVRAQSALAAEQADAVIAVFDGRAGLNPVDRELVVRLRRLRKPVLYAVNKLDTPAHDDEAAEFFALGPSAVFPIAAAHGRGVDALMEHLFELLPAAPVPAVPVPAAPSEEAPVADTGAATSVVTLAIVGKPNVGKSSLLNRLVGSERAIVDAAPGTTRDPVDTPFRYGEREYLLVDTAGIRHRPRVHEHIERACAVRALKAIERAEVALVVMDATQAISDQDARIAGYAWERGRALLFVVNKWDAVPKSERSTARFVGELRARYASFADAPAVFVSARTGAGIAGIFPAVEELVAVHRQQLRTVELNKVLADATRAQAPPSVHGKRPRFYYATQTATAPPTITIFASAPQLLQVAYERYLANAFRAAFRLHGTPLRLRFRQRERRQ